VLVLAFVALQATTTLFAACLTICWVADEGLETVASTVKSLIGRALQFAKLEQPTEDQTAWIENVQENLFIKFASLILKKSYENSSSHSHSHSYS